MNRRDIIIVAVLINAGLLVTLFASSLKRESVRDLASSKPVEESLNTAAQVTPLIEKKRDQIDQVISQYTAMTRVEDKKEEPLPPSVLILPKKEVEEPKYESSFDASLRLLTVEKGDVLEKIARAHGVSVDEIIKLNNLPNSRLQIGQELTLPEKKGSKTESKKEDEGKYYVVKGGDSPWTIAQKHHMQVEELLRLNHIDKEKAKRLRPGDRLKIK